MDKMRSLHTIVTRTIIKKNPGYHCEMMARSHWLDVIMSPPTWAIIGYPKNFQLISIYIYNICMILSRLFLKEDKGTKNVILVS